MTAGKVGVSASRTTIILCMGDFADPTDACGRPYRVGDLVQIVALHIAFPDGPREVLELFNKAACRPLRIDDIDGHPGGDVWLSFSVLKDGSQAGPDACADTLNVLPEEV